jgi:hypothetical protein
MISAIALIAVTLPSIGWAATDVKFSGFLDDYSALAPHPERPNVLAYRAPNFQPKNYSQFMFPPIEIWIDPASEYKGVEPDQLKKVTDRLLEAITDALKDGYPIVDKPGPGVAIIRIALTNVYLKKKKWKWQHYTPIGAATKGVQVAAGKNVALKTAHLEIEMLDSQSGQRLQAGVDFQAGEKLREKIQEGKEAPETTWADVEDTLEFYAKRLRKRMDAARGR